MSLRGRLLTGMAVIAAVLAFAAVFVARSTEAHLLDQVDEQLRRAPVPARGPGFVPQRPSDPAEPVSAAYTGVIHRDGEVHTAQLPGLRGASPPVPQIDGARALAAADARELFTVASSDADVRYRVIAHRVRSSRNPHAVAVVTALPLDDVDDAVQRLVAVEVAATALALAVLGLVTWWVVRLGVRPIKQMTATATAIASGDLSHRVPAVHRGTEAGELGEALNRMLGHIEDAFDQRTRSEERLRQFVADASHELRTPITTIRGYAELHRKGALDDVDERREAMRRTEEEAIRMGALVDDLLHLARLDQGRPLEHAPVDLATLARDAVRDAQASEPSRPIRADAEGQLVVVGDEARLRQVLANLVTNAMVHTEPGTPVVVRARREGGDAVVTVRDEGPGMPPAVAARAFERFYRADPSRARSRGGSGLGLAIVDATVAALGGTVDLDTAPGAGTTVTVRLPISG